MVEGGYTGPGISGSSSNVSAVTETPQVPVAYSTGTSQSNNIAVLVPQEQQNAQGGPQFVPIPMGGMVASAPQQMVPESLILNSLWQSPSY